MRLALARIYAALSRAIDRLGQPRHSSTVARRLERYVGPTHP